MILCHVLMRSECSFFPVLLKSFNKRERRHYIQAVNRYHENLSMLYTMIKSLCRDKFEQNSRNDQRKAVTSWNCPGCYYLKPKNFVAFITGHKISWWYCILNKDISDYRELDPMVEHRMQFAFKGKREHSVSVNIPNMAYPGQHVDIKIPQGSGNCVIVPDTLKIRFNLDITSTEKAHSVVNNVGRALVKKRGSCLVQHVLTWLTIQTFMIHTRIFT